MLAADWVLVIAIYLEKAVNILKLPLPCCFNLVMTEE